MRNGWKAGLSLLALGAAITLSTSCEKADEGGSSEAPAQAASATVPRTTEAPSTTAAPTTTSTTSSTTTAPPTTTTQPEVVAAPALMPDVVCMNLQEAQDFIQTKGVFFSRSHDATGAGRMQVLDSNWIVVGQTPSPGTPIGELEADLAVVKYGEPNRC